MLRLGGVRKSVQAHRRNAVGKESIPHRSKNMSSNLLTVRVGDNGKEVPSPSVQLVSPPSATF